MQFQEWLKETSDSVGFAQKLGRLKKLLDLGLTKLAHLLKSWSFWAKLSPSALGVRAARLKGGWTRFQRCWADGGYTGTLISWLWELCGWVLEIVKRSDDVTGFKPLPRRWVVERTFGWLAQYRRLSRHYEYWEQTGEAMIHVAMIHMLRRLRPRKTSTARDLTNKHKLAA